MALREPHLAHRVGFPALHVKRVRDDARPGLHVVEHARLQFVDELRQQVDGHDARARQVCSQRILHAEFGTLRNARAARVLARQRDQLLVEVHAQSARAEALRGGNHDPPVARTEVDDVVVAAGTG